MLHLLGRLTSVRAALIVHVISLAAALALLFRLDRNRWFVWDEWGFFAFYHPALVRGDWLGFLFAPYFNHWILLPAVWYEIAYRLVGVKAYWLYLAPDLIGHVVLVALVRIVMRRAGVGAWTATALSLPLLLTGAGSDNLWLAWQIGFIGSLVFGVGWLLLSDHPGGAPVRDAVGVVLGVLALMCSAVGVAMVPMVGLNLLLRRRFLGALLSVAPVTAVYLAWFHFYAADGVPSFGTAAGPAPHLTVTTLALVPPFVEQGVATTLDKLTGFPGIAPFLVVALLLGAAKSKLPVVGNDAAPWAMAAGGLIFFAITALGRDQGGTAYATFARYSYVGVALFLPLIGAVSQRWMSDRGTAFVFAGLLAWAMLANVTTLYLEIRFYTAEGLAVKHSLLERAADPNLAARDPNERLPIEASMWVTNRVIVYLRNDGALPTS